MAKSQSAEIPVVLFVFNRHKQLAKILSGIKKNNIPLIYVFADGPRDDNDALDTKKVREVIDQIDWTSVIKIYNKNNKGLSQSIREGLDYVFSKHERAIVLEDDVYVAPRFYEYMKTCLNKYQNNSRIAGITGLRYPFPRKNLDLQPYDGFITPRFSSWGWGTWRSTWETFTFDLEHLMPRLKEIQNDIAAGGWDLNYAVDELIAGRLTGCWDIYVYLNMRLNGQYFFWPKYNYIINTGLTEGTHASGTEPFWKLNWEKHAQKTYNLPDSPQLDDKILKDFLYFFKAVHLNDPYYKERVRESVAKLHILIKSKVIRNLSMGKLKAGVQKIAHKSGYQIIKIHKIEHATKTSNIDKASSVVEIENPDPKDYSTTTNPMEVPCQKVAYYHAINNYVKPDSKVLDVGSGLGYGMAILSVIAREVQGIDVDSKAVRYANTEYVGNNPKIKNVQKYNGYKTPFRNNEFDVVTCIDVLEHVVDYDRFVDELLRISKDYVLISTPNQRPEFTNPDGTPKNYWHLREWKHSELSKILSKHNAVVDWYFVDGPFDGPFTIEKKVSKNTLVLMPVLRKNKQK